MCQKDKTKTTFQSINVRFLTDFFAAGMDAPGYGGMNRLGGGMAVADSHMSGGAMTLSWSVLFDRDERRELRQHGQHGQHGRLWRKGHGRTDVR